MVEMDNGVALARAMGYVLRKRRVEHGWMLKELAELTGLSVSFLCRLEHGKRPLTVTRLVNLCDVLDVSPLSVVTEAQNEAFPFGWSDCR